jgi:hypothetical protein
MIKLKTFKHQVKTVLNVQQQSKVNQSRILVRKATIRQINVKRLKYLIKKTFNVRRQWPSPTRLRRAHKNQAKINRRPLITTLQLICKNRCSDNKKCLEQAWWLHSLMLQVKVSHLNHIKNKLSQSLQSQMQNKNKSLKNGLLSSLKKK